MKIVSNSNENKLQANFDFFIKEVYRTYEYLRPKNTPYRIGQHLMNKLFEVKTELYNKILYTDLDCFYLNSNSLDFEEKMNKTIKFLRENWNNDQL